jgi:hypothetical protein
LFQIKSKFKNSKSEKETSEPVWSLGDGKLMVKGQQGSHQSTVIGHQKTHSASASLQRDGQLPFKKGERSVDEGFSEKSSFVNQSKTLIPDLPPFSKGN